VHTTLVPDFASLIGELSEKPVQPTAARPSLPSQENINPVLNQLYASSNTVNSVAQPPHHIGTFDAFTDINPFTLKTLDAYRMQLWGKMVRDMQHNSANTSPASSPASSPTGLASNIKPLFLDSSNMQAKGAATSPILSAILGAKGAVSNTFAPPTRLLQAHSTPGATTPSNVPQPHHVLLAAYASQTLLNKLTSSFWDAFSGNLPSSAASNSTLSSPFRGNWDADKVRRVLEGRAVVRVVDIDSEKKDCPITATSAAETSSSSLPVDPAKALEESMRALNLSSSSSSVDSAEEKCFFRSLRGTHTRKRGLIVKE
jgi:hypothetical protein